MSEVVIRGLTKKDSIERLTKLLHRAYRPLAAAGMRFLASHQDAKTTKDRCDSGECFVAIVGAEIIGTITLRRPDAAHGCPWFERPNVMSFSQFAVEPSHQGQGIGTQLLDFAERRAEMNGATEIALDTSEHAEDLIRFYEARGYRIVQFHTWGDIVNYRSVVMSKSLSRSGSVGPRVSDR